MQVAWSVQAGADRQWCDVWRSFLESCGFGFFLLLPFSAFAVCLSWQPTSSVCVPIVHGRTDVGFKNTNCGFCDCLLGFCDSSDGPILTTYQELSLFSCVSLWTIIFCRCLCVFIKCIHRLLHSMGKLGKCA